ncbi:MAG: acyl carrier protein [Bacteroidales bacterium]|nr:acyl carrier protein [Bacteroidales bacterium]MBR6001675.1 acyl carrier protein [Bacteroidales bacterium]
MTKEEFIAKLNASLAEEFEVEESVLVPEAPIKETLELDSLSFVDLIALVESVSGVKVAGTEVAKIATFGELYDYVYERM